VSIASLKPGDKVLATDTHTGKTKAEPVAAVLVHHDTNRYNLTVKTAHRTAVIHTTTTHLFWNPSTRSWVKAAALGHGAQLHALGRATVTVISGHAPNHRVGWMWDLTVTGDHDFYIQAATTAVLVHNCPATGGSKAAQGEAGVDQTVADLEAAGGRVLGKEISLKAPQAGWKARADLYVELPNGQRTFLEVKTGPGAELSENQIQVYAETRSIGTIPYGANAAKAEGITPGVSTGPTPVWVVWQPWPLTTLQP
jgi:hypothetical protein